MTTTFRTPYMTEMVLRGVKRAPNVTHPARHPGGAHSLVVRRHPARERPHPACVLQSELMVYPDSGPVHLDPTPMWIVALGDAPDYGWAATGAGRAGARVMRPAD